MSIIMTNDTREFELGAVISAATGRLVAREGFSSMHELFEYITGGPVWTHQLPRLFDECQESLYAQFPWMRGITFPDNIGPENYIAWLDEQVALHGATLKVAPLDPGQFRVIDPVKEAIDMIGPERVVVVKVN